MPLYPYFIVKDFIGLILFFLFYFFFVFYYPDALGHSDNYIEADPLKTPEHIVPEWYFLPFYAILRSIDDKLTGVIFMFLSIIVFFFLPLVDLFFISNFISFYKISSYTLYNRYTHPFFV